MKVLFAVSNESTSQAIIKKYQTEYKQIISYKNVYYFNAILKELQRDKGYDRIVISEDLEQYVNNDYEQMDKFLFDRLDSISDEASDLNGEDIPIILICTERRTKAEPILVKLFGIGIYNAIIGNDRSVNEVCRLINRPRTKKEAKMYYKIDSGDVDYNPEDENDVSELELQNILAHYKRLGNDEDRYVESFDSIASQYNDTQLKIISKCLPLNVRAVLEERSPKYQQVNAYTTKISDSVRYNNKNKQQKAGTSEILLKNSKGKVLNEPVVVPSSIGVNKKKIATRKIETVKVEKEPEYEEEPEEEPEKEPEKESEEEQEEEEESGYHDGTYEGSAYGFGDFITVSVTLKDGKMTDISVISADGEDKPYYTQSLTVLDKMLSTQSTEVDTVSGATLTSEGIIEAVADALGKAAS